jgi:hypothetical protein
LLLQQALIKRLTDSVCNKKAFSNKISSLGLSGGWQQGDQIGRILAKYAIVYFGHLKSYQVAILF